MTERIYHFHVQKTAGSSLNAAFWNLGGLDFMQSPLNSAEGNGLRFARDDAELLERGNYFFGSSHYPAWQLRLPPETFTVTILREPMKRVISYYRYLKWARENPGRIDLEPFVERVREESRFMNARGGLNRVDLKTESAIATLGLKQYLARVPRLLTDCSGFQDFVKRLPPRKLMAQLYLFSERMDPYEAAENILSLDAVCFTETFARDLKRLGDSLGLDLQEKEERSLGEELNFSDHELEDLHYRLAPEHRMIELLASASRQRQTLPFERHVPIQTAAPTG